MVGTLDICVRHMSVSLTFEEMRYGLTQRAERGSLRGEPLDFTPWWAMGRETAEAQFYRMNYRLRLPQMRDLSWRIIQRMSQARDVARGGVCDFVRYHGRGRDSNDEED